MKIKKFNEFVTENILEQVFQRFYMLVRKPFPIDSENVLGQLIGKGRDSIFDQICIDKSNYKTISILPGIPVLNFTEDNDIVKLLLEENIIEKSCLYNNPTESETVSNKVNFHKMFSDCKYVPKTVFTIDDTTTLNFPIIAKPSNGKSAEGIQKFNSSDELQKTTNKFDIFSEAINIKREFRCFCFKDEILELNERIKISGSKDFLKDAKTKTDFYYKDVDPTKYKKHNILSELIKECKLKVDLDFFSIDFAEDKNGELFIIEMNSRTGMGVDKMTNLYRKIYKDFYNTELNELSISKLDVLDKEWEIAYEKEKGTDINECTVVGGKLGDKMFLFKNRDRSFTPNSVVIREEIRGVETVYYTDQTGWIEGMNEHGVGFAFSALTPNQYDNYGPSYFMTDEPKDDSKFKRFAKGIKNVLTANTADDAIKKILASKKSGSFIVSDKNKMLELEVFNNKHELKVLSLDSIYVKTNHGILIPDAGHQPSGKSIKRANSSIRKHQAEQQLSGITSINDVPSAMKFQAFDTESPLNTFRTDKEENTISQCMYNLTDLVFYFFHDDLTANSVELKEMTKKNKIKIDIRKS